MSSASTRHLRAIIQTQTEIAASDLDLDAVMELIARRAQDLTEASGGVIEIADGDEMAYRVTVGEATPFLGLRVKMDSSLSGRCVREEKVLRSDDTATDPRVDSEACQRVGALSMLCVPLIHQEETVGVLKVYASRVDNFGEGDVETLELLSELIAAHMSHASLFAAEVHGGRHDALTGLLNRRAYEERLPVEIARANRYAWPLSLCLLDLDGFKQLNDTFGHPAGDKALQQVAALIDESRITDDSFRIGGDEFALLMPKTCREDAEVAAARLSEQVRHIGMSDGSLGASFGVAEGANDPVALHAQADERLRAAKERLYEGRKRRQR
ncbi:MAG TPA: sensor domain-containing diguanylate cyclase [Solirubrobacterales bacterium]|nr:sensor domain-containing diguanylate cyclase [Solirubrobacterales bacterium]